MSCAGDGRARLGIKCRKSDTSAIEGRRRSTENSKIGALHISSG